MKIELLTIPDCPGAEDARQLLRNILKDSGNSFVETIIRNKEQAKAAHFLDHQLFRSTG